LVTGSQKEKTLQKSLPTTGLMSRFQSGFKRIPADLLEITDMPDKDDPARK